MAGIVERLIEFGMTAPQRRRQEEIYQKEYGPGGYREQELAMGKEKFKLNEKELAFREKQLKSQVDQWAVTNKLAWDKQKKSDVNAWLSVFNSAMDKHPEKAQDIWDIGLAPHFGPAEMTVEPTGDWSVHMDDGTAFMIDKKSGTFKTAQYETPAAGMKMTEFDDAMNMALQGFGNKVMGKSPYAEYQEAIEDPRHPKHQLAMEAQPVVEKIMGGFRGRMGVGAVPPRDIAYQASPYNEGSSIMARLQNFGKPREEMPQSHGKIVRTGIYDDGRKVIQYEDGTVEYAP